MISNRTVLIVSHVTDTLKKFCNRVFWIDNGKFMELGHTNEVLAHNDAFMSTL